MLKIGDFSKLSMISIRMLRHYDEIGLLKPEKVEEQNGYRYYRETQLMAAGRIQALKNMGFGLSAIQEMMILYSDSEELERFLIRHRQEMKQQGQEIQNRLQLLESTIQWLRKDGNKMGFDISLKTLPERYVASVREVIPSYADEGVLWKRLAEETAVLQMQDASPCYAMAVFHDGEYKERDVDVEVQQAVCGQYQDTGHVSFKMVPSVQVASATYKGSYEQMRQVNMEVAKWIEDNGYEFDGRAFNIYHIGPHQTNNEEEYVTEVCFPVRSKELW